MRLRLLAVLALLLFGTAHAAEQNTPSQMARVRITFDRDGITSTRTAGTRTGGPGEGRQEG